MLKLVMLLKKINWTNTFFILFLTPVAAAAGLYHLIHIGGLHAASLVLMLVMLILSGLSITAGYHRLFSHRSYQAAWPIRLFFALFGAAAFQGSILEWCTDHRNHHLYTDTDRDPYDIKKGFFFAHMGWLLVLDTTRRDFSNVAELLEDPIVRIQHRYYVPIAIMMGFVLPTLIALAWGDPWGGLILAGFLKTLINHHATFAINSVCHIFGKRTYSAKQTARDNWFTAFFTFGEGYHNFHHQFPLDYRNGVRFYQYDPTKWLIALLNFCGMAKDLKRIDSQRILRYRLLKEEAEMMKKIGHYSEQFVEQVTNYVKPIYQRILLQLEHIDELKNAYHALKKEQIDSVHKKALKLKLKLASIELNKSLDTWRSLLNADRNALVSVSQS